MEKEEKKAMGEIYTPDNIVINMLNSTCYYGGHILNKHVIDNSCGDGHFLTKIVERYIAAAKSEGKTTEEIAKGIETYVHGIEINKTQCLKCKINISQAASNQGVNVTLTNLDIICQDALTVTKYDGKMDYVYGNPPYVRIQNIKERTGNERYDILKSYSFAKEGAGDLYLAFYELGLRMLSPRGLLCYIAPSSWLTSASGAAMRKHILEHNNLSGVIDFGHKQIFKGINTYSLITAFRNGTMFDKVMYYDGDWKLQYYVPYENLSIDGKFYFTSEENANLLREINACDEQIVRVKNGIATLLDSFFIDECTTDTTPYIEIVKGSTGEFKKCFYPHDAKGDVIPLKKIKKEYPVGYKYIMDNKGRLINRTFDGDYWYAIGRRQGLSDTFKPKVYMNNITKEPADIKIGYLEPGKHVYSGYYITSDKAEIKEVEEEIKKALHSEIFFTYVQSLRKYKSGGYYTFSTKEVEKFLNWHLKKYGWEHVEWPIEREKLKLK